MSLPIITTNVPGCNDVITNKFSGTIIPVRNKEKLKTSIKKYLEDQNWQLAMEKMLEKLLLINIPTT